MPGLYFWVEGDDDERFARTVLVPLVVDRFDFVMIQKYACMKIEKVKSFLTAIQAMKAHAVFLGDLDNSPDPPSRAQALRTKYGVPSEFPVFVVCRSVEGWYLAGLPDLTDRKMWLHGPVDVNTLHKEYFNSGMPRRFRSRIDFLVELLERFDDAVATARSASYLYARKKLAPTV